MALVSQQPLPSSAKVMPSLEDQVVTATRYMRSWPPQREYRVRLLYRMLGQCEERGVSVEEYGHILVKLVMQSGLTSQGGELRINVT